MKAQDLIKRKPYLLWHTKNYRNLSDEAVVEAVLNYGDWDDVRRLFKILGLKKAAKIFHARSKPSKVYRQNYRPEVKNYFALYFNKHAPRNTDKRAN